MESLGGEFLIPNFDDDDEEGDMEGTGYSRIMSEEYYMKEMELFREQCKECQIIVSRSLYCSYYRFAQILTIPLPLFAPDHDGCHSRPPSTKAHHEGCR